MTVLNTSSPAGSCSPQPPWTPTEAFDCLSTGLSQHLRCCGVSAMTSGCGLRRFWVSQGSPSSLYQLCVGGLATLEHLKCPAPCNARYRKQVFSLSGESPRERRLEWGKLSPEAGLFLRLWQLGALHFSKTSFLYVSWGGHNCTKVKVFRETAHCPGLPSHSQLDFLGATLWIKNAFVPTAAWRCNLGRPVRGKKHTNAQCPGCRGLWDTVPRAHGALLVWRGCHGHHTAAPALVAAPMLTLQPRSQGENPGEQFSTVQDSSGLSFRWHHCKPRLNMAPKVELWEHRGKFSPSKLLKRGAISAPLQPKWEWA